MKILWKNENEFKSFQKIINSELKLFFKIYEEKNYGVSENPIFKAYWKDKIHHSMSHQSVMEGIRKEKKSHLLILFFSIISN